MKLCITRKRQVCQKHVQEIVLPMTPSNICEISSSKRQRSKSCKKVKVKVKQMSKSCQSHRHRLTIGMSVQFDFDHAGAVHLESYESTNSRGPHAMWRCQVWRNWPSGYASMLPTCFVQSLTLDFFCVAARQRYW